MQIDAHNFLLTEGTKMEVRWDQDVCSHAGVCVNSLPKVFKVEDGSFVIDTDAASEAEIRGTVSKCPSGALTIKD